MYDTKCFSKPYIYGLNGLGGSWFVLCNFIGEYFHGIIDVSMNYGSIDNVTSTYSKTHNHVILYVGDMNIKISA